MNIKRSRSGRCIPSMHNQVMTEKNTTLEELSKKPLVLYDFIRNMNLRAILYSATFLQRQRDHLIKIGIKGSDKGEGGLMLPLYENSHASRYAALRKSSNDY